MKAKTNQLTNPWRILILQGVPQELELLLEIMRADALDFEYTVVDNRASFKKTLSSFEPDIILTDNNIASYTALDALKDALVYDERVPFILITDRLGEEKAVEIIKSGVWDFVLKENYKRIPLVIRRAMKDSEECRKIKAQESLEELEERYRLLFENTPIGIFELNYEGKLLVINKQAEKIFDATGEPSTDILISDFFHEDEVQTLDQWLSGKVNDKGFTDVVRIPNTKKHVDITLIPQYDKKRKTKKYIGIAQDITKRFHTESELINDNLLMNSILDTISDIVYHKDTKGCYVMVNSAFEQMFDVKAEDVINKVDADFMESPLRSEAAYTDKEVMITKRLVTVQESYLDSDNRLVIFDTHKKPILNDHNEVIGIVGVSRDVTDRVKAQEKLRRSEAILLEAEGLASFGSWEFDLANERISCSIGASRLLNVDLTEREFSYSTFLNRSVEKDRRKLMDVFKNAVLDGESFDIDHRIRLGDDSVKWLKTKGRPHQNQRNDIDKVVGTIQDITSQKRSEHKLEKSRQLLKEAQSIANMGSFDWNISQNILECSDQFYDILQLSSNGLWLTIDSYLELIHPLDRELTRKSIFEALNSANTYDIEHRVLLEDGTVKVLRGIGQFKADSNNQPDRLFGTIQDVSEKTHIETALIEGQELERKRIAIEIHDGIGQLLAATKFNLSALENMPEEDVEEHLAKIHNTLETTIDEARRITKNLSTKILEELGLKKALNELCNEAKQIKNIDLLLKYDIEDSWVSDKVKTSIYRIVQESVNNLIKYSNAKSGFVELIKENNYMLLTIEDDGIGFDINDDKNNRGNGLANLSQRAKNLHGYLDLKSELGKGTSINVKIPFEITE